MVINSNLDAQAAVYNLQASHDMLSKSLSRLSTGLKIVNPSDDAAGVAVSSRLDAQIKRLGAAQANVGNAISFTQTQDGFLTKVAKALNRMSELTMLAQDVTKSDADRSLYNGEYQQLSAFITNTGTKDFNGVSLFSANSLNVTIDSEGGTFTMNGIDLAAPAYTAATSDTLTTVASAVSALVHVRNAITQMAADRANIGAYQSRMDSVSDQLTVNQENLTAATSRIEDVDVAQESTQYARYNILVQSGTAMLAQANALPQTVLRLLQ